MVSFRATLLPPVILCPISSDITLVSEDGHSSIQGGNALLATYRKEEGSSGFCGPQKIAAKVVPRLIPDSVPDSIPDYIPVPIPNSIP